MTNISRTKESLISNIDKVYQAWVKAEYFAFETRDMCIEDFLYEYDEELSKKQKDFLESLLSIYVEIQNHENME